MKPHKFEGKGDNCDRFEGGRQCCLERDAEIHLLDSTVDNLGLEGFYEK